MNEGVKKYLELIYDVLACTQYNKIGYILGIFVVKLLGVVGGRLITP